MRLLTALSIVLHMAGVSSKNGEGYKWVLGSVGQSCTSACAAHSMNCDQPEKMAAVGDRELSKITDDLGLECKNPRAGTHSGNWLPALFGYTGDANNNSCWGYTEDGAFGYLGPPTCDGKWGKKDENWSRLCYCTTPSCVSTCDGTTARRCKYGDFGTVDTKALCCPEDWTRNEGDGSRCNAPGTTGTALGGHCYLYGNCLPYDGTEQPTEEQSRCVPCPSFCGHVPDLPQCQTTTTTSTTTLLNLHDQCDPRADLCNVGKDLVCQPDTYTCVYATTATTATTTNPPTTSINNAKATGAPPGSSNNSVPGDKTNVDGDDGSDGESKEQDDAGNREDDVDLENPPSKSRAGGVITGILVTLLLVAVVSAVLCARKKELARQGVLTNAAALRRRAVRQQNAGYAGGGADADGGGGSGNGNAAGNVSDFEPFYGNDEFGNVEPKPDNYGYGIPDPLPEGHDGSTGSNAAGAEAAATYSPGLPSMQQAGLPQEAYAPLEAGKAVYSSSA